MASSSISRRTFLNRTAATLAALGATPAGAAPEAAPRPPNFIFIFADDLGYADLACYGAPNIETPRLDQMARDGIRFTDFYSAAPVCTPSRAALMTGCYPPRVGLGLIPAHGKRGPSGVLHPGHPYGLNPAEITIAQLLRDHGYATGCIGKWHLGDRLPFLPTCHGFDYYYGIPYSNDMQPAPILRNTEIAVPEADQDALVENYAEEAVGFIKKHKNQPFFLYFPHNMPHVPLHASQRFRGKSDAGFYGDVIASIDWSIGRILDTLAEEGLAANTLVMFSSDNGPWLVKGEHGGLATPLRGGKGSTYEGGMRVPCVAQWPGQIPPGTTCREVAGAIDILPTFARLAGATPPQDRTLDGRDISPLLRAEPGARSPHAAYFYYSRNSLQAVRAGDWKLKFEIPLQDEDLYRRYPHDDLKAPEALYNLAVDIGEQKNVASDHPEAVERLRAFAQEMRQDLGDDLTGVAGSGTRPIGIAEG